MVNMKRATSVISTTLLLIIVSLVVVYYVKVARRQARNAQCKGRLGQIALALQNYAEQHGTFPPTAIAGPDGRPLLSWRVLLLPVFDETVAYGRLNLDESWDSQKNVAAMARGRENIGRLFHSPNDFSSETDTSFVAIGFPVNRHPGSRIIIIELHGTKIHWSEPDNLTFAEIRSRVVDLVDRGEAVHFITADGRIGTIIGSSLMFTNSPDELLRQWATPE